MLIPDTGSPAKISVVMPNYNDSAHIRAQLLAVCRQSHQPYEVIVIDDGSTDNSVSLVEEIAREFSFVRVLKNDRNLGIIHSVNRAASLISGEFLYIPASNDVVHPGLFEKSLRLLAQYPQASFCCSDGYLDDGNSIWDILTGWRTEAGYISPQELAETTRRAGMARMPLSHTCIIRRAVIAKSDLWKSELECYCDWFFYQVLAFRHGCCFLPERLVTQKWSPNSYCERVKSDDKRHQRIFLEIIKLLAMPENKDVAELIVRGRTLLCFLPKILTAGNVRAALDELRQSPEEGVGADDSSNARTFSQEQKDLLLTHVRKEQALRMLSLLPELSQSFLQQSKQRFLIPLAFRVQNIFDRVFAHAFHLYDQLRSAIPENLKKHIEK
ncbi:MAG: glycosyltransferase family 2 protein [Candidatus Obscuribacterales bacterium]|nr:glycosyltransferase family 2 protein [Candidatus Obscuribacterales bacterium]